MPRIHSKLSVCTTVSPGELMPRIHSKLSVCTTVSPGELMPRIHSKLSVCTTVSPGELMPRIHSKLSVCTTVSPGELMPRIEYILAMKCALNTCTMNSSPTLNTLTVFVTNFLLMYSLILHSVGRSDREHYPKTFPEEVEITWKLSFRVGRLSIHFYWLTRYFMCPL